MIIIVLGALATVQRIGKGTGGLGNKRASGNHPKNRIMEIGQDIEKSPECMSRLAVTQTPVQNYQQTLM